MEKEFFIVLNVQSADDSRAFGRIREENFAGERVFEMRVEFIKVDLNEIKTWIASYLKLLEVKEFLDDNFLWHDWKLNKNSWKYFMTQKSRPIW